MAIAGFILWYSVLKTDNLEVSTTNINAENSDEIQERDNVDGSWIVSQQQDVFVGYEIAELFAGDSVKVPAIGTTRSVTGSFTIETGELSNANIVADMTLLSSDSSTRDSKMRSEGLETDKFPEAKFEQTNAITLPSVLEKNSEIKVTIPGKLTLHGVSKDISVDLNALWDGKVITVSGEIDIVLSDYDIEAPNSSFVTVDNEGIIKLQLLFIPNN